MSRLTYLIALRKTFTVSEKAVIQDLTLLCMSRAYKQSVSYHVIKQVFDHAIT